MQSKISYENVENTIYLVTNLNCNLSMVAVNGSDQMEEVQAEVTPEVSYDAKCALTIPIARPLAPRKLSKKLYKCSKAAIKVRCLRRGSS